MHTLAHDLYMINNIYNIYIIYIIINILYILSSILQSHPGTPLF